MATVFKKEETVHHFDACGGDSFRPTVIEVIEYLKLHNYDRASAGRPSITATLKFNEHTVNISQDSDPDKVWDEFKEMMDAATKAYGESPAGIQAALDAVNRWKAAQEKLDSSLWHLRFYANEEFPAQKADGFRQPVGETAKGVWTMLWQICDASDHREVKWDKEEFVQTMNALGYVRNEYAGDAKLEVYDLETYRAYVAGQILDCLRPEAFGLIPPVAGVKIEEHGLMTDTFIP